MGEKIEAGSPNLSVLSFSIQTDKQAYRFGEPILLRGTLENQGDQTLLVNRKLLVHSSEVQEGGWGVALKIIAPSGKKIDVGWLYELGSPHADWFLWLYPRQGFIYTISGNLWNDIGPRLTEEGTYHITATYSNFIEKAPGLERWMKPWTGTVESNTLAIDLTK